MLPTQSNLTRRQRLFENSMRNSGVVLRSYEWGWHIDPERQAMIAGEIKDGIAAADAAIVALLLDERVPEEFAKNFNANSSAQVGKLLYDILREPVRLRTPEGSPSAGKDALEQIKLSGGDLAKQLATALRQRKILARLNEAYIQNLAGMTVVRSSVFPSIQLTGRWSSRDPALTTTPPKIKPMFVTRNDNWMVASDLAGAEYRTMALMSGDQGMLDAFNSWKDLHAHTAVLGWGCPVEESKQKKWRNPAKRLGLGCHYSSLEPEAAATGLYHQLIAEVPWVTYDIVLGAVKRLIKERPRVFEFKAEALARAQELGYVEELLLRRRRYFLGKIKDTEVFNFPHQAMIATIVDWAVQAIDALLDHTREGLLLQRHDELMLEGPDALRLVRLLWQHLRQTHSHNGNSITFEIDFWIGKRWGEGGCAIEPKNGIWYCAPRDGRASAEFNNMDAAIEYAIAA